MVSRCVMQGIMEMDIEDRYSEKRKEITSSCIMSDLQLIRGAF